MKLRFIETEIFTEQIQELVGDESYFELQQALLEQPDSGDLIPQSGGLRKVRWRVPGRGKRGGVRVIYYWVVSDKILLMLYAYQKNQQEDLTADQLRVLKKIVENYEQT